MVQLKAGLVGAATSLLCTLLLLSTAYARADEPAPRSFDIRPQSLATALTEFARQSHEEILFAPEVVAQKRSAGVRGTMQPLAALKVLLKDTGLPFISTPSGAILVGSAGSVLPPTSAAEAAANAQKEGKKSSSDGFRVAQMDQGASADSSSVARRAEQAPQSKAVPLEEVIVTAQKRSERLEDVPVPVAVIGADTLVNSHQTLLRDYYSSVPGLSLTTTTQSSQILSIRGIVTNPGNPTVGITIDDMPFGSTTIGGGGLVVPDFDPGDLSRIEVLRGPQGTLYGASSLGGLIKFVTIDPTTDRLAGKLQAGVTSVHNGSQVGYIYRGAINVPLGDTLAVRGSGFARLDPGYIDNPVLNVRGLNAAHAAGGLLSALWQPVHDFTLKLSALLQQVKGGGSSDADVQPGLGDLQQNYIPGVGGYDRRVQAYSATLKARFVGLDLVSVTGYNVNKFSDSWDFTFALGPSTQTQFGVSGTPIATHNRTSKFTQEIRLSSSIGKKIDWMLGAFYTHESSEYVQNLLAENAATGTVVGSWCECSSPSTYTEYAVFPDLTYHVTDRFEVQVGARQSRIRQTFLPQVNIGPYDPVFLGAPSPVIVPAAYASGNPFTYLATPQYRVSPDLMLYVRLASGYQAGGSNQGTPGAPPQYSPSRTRNYEIGAKGDILDHMLSFDASLYYIRWKDIQLTFLDPQTFIAYNGNGSGAKSQGAELSVKAAPLQGMTIGAWFAYDDAELTEAFPAGVVAAGEYGIAGDRLPFSSRYSGYLSAEQSVPLAANWVGYVGGDVGYVGDRIGFFSATSQRTMFPAYWKADLRAGVKYDSWAVNVFANNLADKRAAISGGLGYFPPFALQYIQPRTIGLNVSKTF